MRGRAVGTKREKRRRRGGRLLARWNIFMQLDTQRTHARSSIRRRAIEVASRRGLSLRYRHATHYASPAVVHTCIFARERASRVAPHASRATNRMLRAMHCSAFRPRVHYVPLIVNIARPSERGQECPRRCEDFHRAPASHRSLSHIVARPTKIPAITTVNVGWGYVRPPRATFARRAGKSARRSYTWTFVRRSRLANQRTVALSRPVTFQAGARDSRPDVVSQSLIKCYKTCINSRYLKLVSCEILEFEFRVGPEFSS